MNSLRPGPQPEGGESAHLIGDSADYLPVVVIGAGLSGLTTAYTLRQRGLDAHLFEASANVGGVIRTELRDGFLLEIGPQSFSFTESLRKLARDLRIEDQIVPAAPKLPRFIFLDGRLAPAPLGPVDFFTSRLFGLRTKWTVFRDVIGSTKPPNPTAYGEESVAQFINRKFSRELVDKLVGPFVSGIYAGDPEKLGLRSAFPQLFAAENSHGSVIRGLMKTQRGSPGARGSATFEEGTATLTNSLAMNLGASLHLNFAASRIAAPRSAARGRFVVEVQDTSAAPIMSARTFRTDHVIVAAPADTAALLLASMDPSIAQLLAAIPYVPVSVVSLGYRRSAVKNTLHGFGFLTAQTPDLRILGCVWNSSLFAGRAPDGFVLLTCFLGGINDPGITKLSPSELKSIAHQELHRILGISEDPVIAYVHTWSRAIPQYDLTHYQRTQILSQKVAAFPGLALGGNYLDGPAVGTVVDRARRVADYVLDGPPR